MSDESDSLSGTKHEALALIVKGMKVADAAERFGVSALTLSRWGRESGIMVSQSDIFRTLKAGDIGGPAGKWSKEKAKMLREIDEKRKKLEREYESKHPSKIIHPSLRKNSKSGLYEILDQDGVVLGRYERRKTARGQVTRLKNKAQNQRVQSMREQGIQQLRQGTKRADVPKITIGNPCRYKQCQGRNHKLHGEKCPVASKRGKKGGKTGEGDSKRRAGESNGRYIDGRAPIRAPKTRTKKKSTALKEEALMMIREGATGVMVAKRLGVHKDTVRRWRKDADLSGKSGWPSGSSLKEEGLIMIKEGITGAEVARRLGVHPGTVRKWRRDAGLSGKDGKKFHEVDKENDVIDLLREGRSMHHINKSTGVGKKSILRIKADAEREGYL